VFYSHDEEDTSMTLVTTGKQEFSRISVLQDFRQPELYQWADTV
jgi:hypothetical protein